MPLLVVCTSYESRVAAGVFNDLPDVQYQIISKPATAVFIIMISTCCLLSAVCIVSVVCKRRDWIAFYAQCQGLISLLFLVSCSIFFVRYMQFSGASFMGITTYYD